jgi:hypothetical protein
MKVTWIGFLIVCSISFFAFDTPAITTVKSIDKYTCDSIPLLNQGIIAFVKNHLKKKVGRGECWDLAAEPLNELGATWDKEYVFGEEVNYKTDCIYPGDIIQFEDVIVKTVKGNMTITAVLDHHTAIVYEVTGRGKYLIAHQNTSEFGRKVGLTELDLANIQKGSVIIYRPYK